MADKEVEDDLVDYDEEEDAVEDTNDSSKEVKKGSYTGIHASGFKDFFVETRINACSC
jgi:ATP-dependent RNA helicase UAP56/SUB2